MKPISSYRRAVESPEAIKGRRNGKIVKSAAVLREKRERRETMAKLHELVPAVPCGADVSKLELLQHVIDYIFHLQNQLVDDSDRSVADQQYGSIESPPASPMDFDLDRLQGLMQIWNCSSSSTSSSSTPVGLC